MSSRFGGGETDSRAVDLEIIGLKAKNKLLTLGQLSGFLLVFLGVYEMFGPWLELNGIDLSILPTEMLDSAIAQLGVSPLITMVGGAVVIWLLTSTR